MGMLGTFDFADPNLLVGARAQTIVPAQALFMMNSEFVHQQSRALADLLLGDTALQAHEKRIYELFRVVYGRQPRPDELTAAHDFITSFTAVDADSEQDLERSAWTGLCQAVFGSNEFLFQD